MMRNNGAMYYFINGTKVGQNTSPEMLALDFGDYGGYEITFFIDEQYSDLTAKLGPLRFTPNRARYNPAGFTPNSLPFRP